MNYLIASFLLTSFAAIMLDNVAANPTPQPGGQNIIGSGALQNLPGTLASTVKNILTVVGLDGSGGGAVGGILGGPGNPGIIGNLFKTLGSIGGSRSMVMSKDNEDEPEPEAEPEPAHGYKGNKKLEDLNSNLASTTTPLD